MSEYHRIHCRGLHEKTPGHYFVKRRPQPPVHHIQVADPERGEIDLRRLAAGAAAELEAIEQKRRSREIADTINAASPRELAMMARPAIERLKGQAEAGHTPVR